MPLPMKHALYIIRHVLREIIPEAEPIQAKDIVDILTEFCGDYEIDRMCNPTYIYNLRRSFASDVMDIVYHELWYMLNDFVPSWDFEIAEYNDISLYLYGGAYEQFESDNDQLPVFGK